MNKVIVFRNDLLLRSETFIREQAQSLRKWRPVLVGYDQVKGGLALDGLEARIIPGAATNTISRYALRLRQMLGRPHSAAVQVLRATGAQLVHAHFGTDATDIWPSVKALRLPMTVTLHGYDINIRREWWESGKGGIHRRSYPRRLLKMAQEPSVHFIAVSHAIKSRAIDYGIPEGKISVCHIGVDTERFQPGGLALDQRNKRILFVGRMVEKKAPLMLIRAFSELRKQVPDAELAMIGGGPLLNDARQLAQNLDVPVEFFGAQGSDIVQQQLNQARLLCLPSVTAENGDAEGFGLVILEAQACGVPVVTSAMGGAAEGVLDGVTGSIFEERDLHALVKGLLGLIETDSALMDASAAAVQFVQDRFDVRDCSACLEHIFDRLTAIERQI